SEQDESRGKALKQAIAELHKIAGQIKSVKPGELSAEKKVLVLRRADATAKKPISPEQKAEIDQARDKVKKLTGEVAAKQKELAEAHARLAKLEGAHAGAVVVLREQIVRGDTVKPMIVSPKHVVRPDGERVIIERKEVRKDDEKVATVGK